VLASLGEIEFSWIGFVFQVGGIVFEAMRVVMVEVLLKGEGEMQKMDPLVSLYYYAPVCAAMNAIVALLTESGSFNTDDLWHTGVGVLVLNAAVAFMLNVSSVFLVCGSPAPVPPARDLSHRLTPPQIGKTSGLVLTLTGILKNVLLIFASILIWHTSITALQFLGYSVALLGLLIYSETLKWEHVTNFGTLARGWWESPSLDENRLSPVVKKAAMAGLACLIVIMLVVGLNFQDAVPLPSPVSGAS